MKVFRQFLTLTLLLVLPTSYTPKETSTEGVSQVQISSKAEERLFNQDYRKYDQLAKQSPELKEAVELSKKMDELYKALAIINDTNNKKSDETKQKEIGVASVE